MKHLEKFDKYAITETKREYDFGCLMLDFQFPAWESLLDKIDSNDLYEPNQGRYGLEESPHITILYGLHDEVTADIIEEKFGNLLNQPIKINIAGIGVFENADYDVVKLDVESSQLKELNKLCAELPHTTEYPDYKPHMTIAYVKKGTGTKYKESLKMNFELKPKFRLSLASGEQIHF